MECHKALSLALFYLLFLLMIFQITSATVYWFSTQMTQFIHSDNINNIDQQITRAKVTLSNAKTYFLKRGLVLNSSKTQFILIGTRQLLSNIPDDMTINFDGNIIPISKHVKILGIYVL